MFGRGCVGEYFSARSTELQWFGVAIEGPFMLAAAVGHASGFVAQMLRFSVFYAKRTEARMLSATRKRHAHALANQIATSVQNATGESVQNENAGRSKSA
jgi:hypothetical protein